MSKVYDSLFQQMQARLNSTKNSSRHHGPPAEKRGGTIKDELDGLEKNVAIYISRFRDAIAVGEKAVERERRNTEQAIQSLKDEISRMEDAARVAGETAQLEQGRAQERERSLSAQIQELNATRNEELREAAALKEKADAQTTEIRELQYALEEGKLETAGYVKRIEAITETYTTRTSDLERRLLEAEQMLAERDSEARSANDRLQDFKQQSEGKDALMRAREAEINQLRKQLHLLTHGIKEMSSFFTQVDAFETNGSRELTNLAAAPTGAEPDVHRSWFDTASTATATLNITDPMPPEFFKELTDALTEAVGPFASVIIKDQVKHLGASVEQFPKGRVVELIDLLSGEIVQPTAKADFRARFSKHDGRLEDSMDTGSDANGDATSAKAE